MNQEKIVKGLMYLCGFALSIFLSAVLITLGSKNNIMLVLGVLIIPVIFFFAYRGFKSILEAIFD